MLVAQLVYLSNDNENFGLHFPIIIISLNRHYPPSNILFPFISLKHYLLSYILGEEEEVTIIFCTSLLAVWGKVVDHYGPTSQADSIVSTEETKTY